MSMSTILSIPKESLLHLGLQFTDNIHYQLDPEELTSQTLARGEGVLNDTGALVISTGKFTGRSPKDKFIVKDTVTENTVDWNDFNIPIEEKYFLQLKDKMLAHLANKEIWVRDCYACADENFRLRLRVINENPWSNLFCYNMFIRPEEKDLNDFIPHWHIIQAPEFKADPAVDGVRTENFAILSFTHKIILIGGTGYTGEMKKGIFTMLNFVLPTKANVLSMHCSANIGEHGDTAIFFGLSGTGKTTLSADPHRKLIGDDEHGWTSDSVFNFEGGCYAKTIDLSEDKEPEIFHAVRPGALVENVTFIDGTNTIDFASKKITENTRVSYPLNFISNAIEPSIGNLPKNIFFLTCDAYGVLPPISKLTPGQAMYQFISGYTAKVAGTEAGVTEPKSTFSACFGAPFLPLHPTQYAKLLGEKLKEHKVNIWLINTGWTGGPYGIGKRMKLNYTRAMITAALEGALDNVEYDKTHWFKLSIPKTCPNVPAEILNPKNTWPNPEDFDTQAKKLSDQFNKNFEKYAGSADDEILAAAPRI
ncbi:phosphoenolpyruvate carboxykinase (ATP) [Ferruginibacter sp. SUN002]|uniref:phosphoenolpyruvate carboxykinase (ATP) n=1 Tax=Ferruginibacter sp. SUN002 TaxID=2937789 RepID=UPI003D36DD20